MAKAKNPIPEGFHTLTPHITVNGAANYIDFLKRAFNAVEISRSPGPGAKLMHAHVRIGDSDLMFNDDFPEMGHRPIAEGRWPIALHMYVPDVDAVFAQAIAAGCEVTMPLADQFWGDRYGHVRDPFGFTWAIATHIEDPTPAEIKEREAKLFGSGSGAPKTRIEDGGWRIDVIFYRLSSILYPLSSILGPRRAPRGWATAPARRDSADDQSRTHNRRNPRE